MLFFEESNVVNGVAGHFIINDTGFGFNLAVFEHSSHAQAVFDRSQMRIFGKRMLVVGKQPDLVEVFD